MTPATERLAPLVVLAVEAQPEQLLDEALRLAPLEMVALQRLVDPGEVGNEAAAEPFDHHVGVALEHHREGLHARQDLGLALGLHRAEQRLGVLGDPGERRRVVRVDLAELLLERGRVDLVRGDVLDGQPDEPLAHPRHRPLRRVHHLVQRDGEAQVLAARATTPPRTRRGSATTNARLGVVVGGQREVVAAQRVLAEVADHRAGLHAEQQRGEHREQPAERVAATAARTRTGSAPDGWSPGPGLVVLAGLERLAQRDRERLEHRPQRVE